MNPVEHFTYSHKKELEEKKIYLQNWDLVAKAIGDKPYNVELKAIDRELVGLDEKRKKRMKRLGSIPFIGGILMLPDFLTEPGKDLREAYSKILDETPEDKERLINILED
jgi:hypothetical protein